MRDSTFRERLFNELRELEGLKSQTDRELNYIVFKHPAGNRLTFAGLVLLKKLYASYEFNFVAGEKLNTRHLISLSREIKLPYYIGNSRLVLFGSEDSFMLKLYGNDIRQWLESAETRRNLPE